MAEEVFGFDRPGMTRVVSAVRALERSPRAVGAQATPSAPPTPKFWIELTAEPSTGHYSWKKVHPSPSGGGWVDAAPAETGAGSASETNLTAGIPAGVRVEAQFIGFDGSDPKYMFAAAIVDIQYDLASHKLQVDYGGGNWVDKVDFSPCP